MQQPSGENNHQEEQEERQSEPGPHDFSLPRAIRAFGLTTVLVAGLVLIAKFVFGIRF